MPARVQLPRGVVLHGWLTEPDAKASPPDCLTTAFVTIDGSQSEVRIDGKAGHPALLRTGEPALVDVRAAIWSRSAARRP